MSKLTLNNIAQVLVGENGMTQKEAVAFATAMFDVIQDRINAEGLVKVKGLGTFKKIQVESRESINVRTGERVLINSHDKVAFTPDNVMKELVNRPFSQFETVALNDDVEFADMKSDAPAEEKAPTEQTETVAEEQPEPTEAPSETVAEEQPEPMEAPSETVVEAQPEPTDTDETDETDDADETDESDETHRLRNAGVVLLVAMLMAASAVGGYLYGIRQHADLRMPQENNRVEQPTPVKVDTLARDTVKVDTLVAKRDTAVQDTLEKYAAMDARVRLGAYKIVGMEREVKARPGDNLKRIAKREFGSEDMVCYLEVYNGLEANQELEKGQTIKIPALKWKKKKRQNQ